MIIRAAIDILIRATIGIEIWVYATILIRVRDRHID